MLHRYKQTISQPKIVSTSNKVYITLNGIEKVYSGSGVIIRGDSGFYLNGKPVGQIYISDCRINMKDFGLQETELSSNVLERKQTAAAKPKSIFQFDSSRNNSRNDVVIRSSGSLSVQNVRTEGDGDIICEAGCTNIYYSENDNNGRNDVAASLSNSGMFASKKLNVSDKSRKNSEEISNSKIAIGVIGFFAIAYSVYKIAKSPKLIDKVIRCSQH